MGEQCVRIDAAGFQQLACTAIFHSGHSQQHMGRPRLPESLMFRFPGRLTQNSSGRPGQSLGKGQLRPADAIEQHGQLPQEFRLDAE